MLQTFSFRISSAAEVFQGAIHHEIPGCINISDDVNVFGVNEAQHEAVEESASGKTLLRGTVFGQHCVVRIGGSASENICASAYRRTVLR